MIGVPALNENKMIGVLVLLPEEWRLVYYSTAPEHW